MSANARTTSPTAAAEPPTLDDEDIAAIPSAEEDSSGDNAVRRTVREFIRLTDTMDDIRAVLRAHGVPLRVTRILVELGLQKQPEKQSEAMESALAQAERAHGSGALDAETLREHVTEIVRLEQDMDHARRIARDLGLDARSLAVLSQLIQSNPGDGGERAVNLILAYARACGIALDGVPQMAAELSAPPASVLPRIERGTSGRGRETSRSTWLRDAAIGLLIGVVVIGLLV